MDTPRLALHAATNYFRMIVLIGTTVALTPRVIDRLGPEAFGLWALVNAAIGFATLLEAGFGNAVLRASAGSTTDQATHHRNRLFSTLLLTTVVLSCLGFVVAVAVSSRLPGWVGVQGPRASEASAIFVVLAARQFLVALPLGLFRGLLYGDGRLLAINTTQSITAVAQFACTWVALGAGYGLPAMAVLSLASGLVEHVTYAWLASRRVHGLVVSQRLATWGALREAASFCGASLLMGVSGLVLLKTDPLLASLFLPLPAIALYAVALKIAENMLLLVKQLANALTPVIARLASDGEPAAMRQVLLTSTKVLLVPGVLGCVGTVLHGRQVLALWVGPSFAAAWPVLVVLTIAMTLTISELSAGNMLVLGGHHGVAARAAVASTTINVVASVVLVQWLGLVGIAAGTLVAAVLVDLGIVVRTALRQQGIGLFEYVAAVWAPVLAAGGAQAGAVTLTTLAVGQPTTLAGLTTSAMVGILAFLTTFALIGPSRIERDHLASRFWRPLTARVAGLAVRAQAEVAR